LRATPSYAVQTFVSHAYSHVCLVAKICTCMFDSHIIVLDPWSSHAWDNCVLQVPMNLQGSTNSMWVHTNLLLVLPTSGLRVVEFYAGGFYPWRGVVE
jgi:hypothetical protein